MTRRMSRPARWEQAVSEAREALDQLKEAARDFDLDSFQTASGALENALSDLGEVKNEYQDWFDNMPENLQYDSPTGQLLQAITEIDTDVTVDFDAIQSAIADAGDRLEQVLLAVDEALYEVEQALDEADGVELPRGFGRD